MPETQTLLLFAAASLALIAVPGAVGALHRHAQRRAGPAGRASCRCSGIEAGALVHVAAAARRRVRARGLLGHGVHGAEVRRGRLPRLPRRAQAARAPGRRRRGERRTGAPTGGCSGRARSVNALNPKTATFFVAFLPAVHRSRRAGSVALQALVLGCLFVVVAVGLRQRSGRCWRAAPGGGCAPARGQAAMARVSGGRLRRARGGRRRWPRAGPQSASWRPARRTSGARARKLVSTRRTERGGRAPAARSRRSVRRPRAGRRRVAPRRAVTARSSAPARSSRRAAAAYARPMAAAANACPAGVRARAMRRLPAARAVSRRSTGGVARRTSAACSLAALLSATCPRLGAGLDSSPPSAMAPRPPPARRRWRSRPIVNRAVGKRRRSPGWSCCGAQARRCSFGRVRWALCTGRRLGGLNAVEGAGRGSHQAGAGRVTLRGIARHAGGDHPSRRAVVARSAGDVSPSGTPRGPR